MIYTYILCIPHAKSEYLCTLILGTVEEVAYIYYSVLIVVKFFLYYTFSMQLYYIHKESKPVYCTTLMKLQASAYIDFIFLFIKNSTWAL